MDVSLYGVAMHNLSYLATWYLNQGVVTGRTARSGHPSLVPSELYRTQDGWIFVMCMTEKFWQALLKEIAARIKASGDKVEDYIDFKLSVPESRYTNWPTALQEQFRSRETGKTYAALVSGTWPAKLKVIDVALHKYLDAGGERRVRAVDNDHADGRRSVSLVKIAQTFEHYTLLDVTIKTGRTHQIRVHLVNAGHPIVGDDKYGDFALNKQLARGEGLHGLRFERMFLHARRLAFDHPATGQRIELLAPLPAECATLLTRLSEPH